MMLVHWPLMGGPLHLVQQGGAWVAQPGDVGGGDNVAPTFVTSGVQGGGPVKMIFPSTADSLYTVLYKWLNFNSPDSSRHLPS